MTVLAPQSPTIVGITPAYTAVTATDSFPAAAGAKYVLHYKCTGGAPVVATIDDPTSVAPAGTLAGAFNPDPTLSVPATTGDKMMLIDANRFRDSSGNINLAHAPTTGGTVAVIGPF